jgi:superfamily I DNA/RNA helicase/RecB family exonuclease
MTSIDVSTPGGPSPSSEGFVPHAAQLQVMDHAAGPLVALGGPGSGKTTVLEERFIRLALSPGCAPDRILFLVPNRAQKIALRDRITKRLLIEHRLEALVEVPVYTWHGFANHLVGRHFKELGYAEPPVLLTSPEQWGEIRDALAAENGANWPRYKSLLGRDGFVDEVVDFCIRAEQRVLQEPELRRLVAARPDFAEIVTFYRKQRNRLRSGSRIDYPTLLEEAAGLLADHEPIRAALGRRFQHILVDDAQELARVQQRLLLFLAGERTSPDGAPRSLVLAADPDSSIETFRGAEPAWLARLSDDFGPYATVALTTSYRCGPDFGGAVDGFIARAGPGSHRPRVWAGRATLEAHRFPSLAAELEAVARGLRLAHLEEGIEYADMAVLLSTPAAMLPPLERALRAVEVPYSIAVPDRPLEREPAVASFRNLARYALQDDPEALADLLRAPLVGLTEPEVRDLERSARLAEKPLAEVLEDLPAAVPDSVRARVDGLGALRDALRTQRDAPADDAFWAIWSAAPHYRELEHRALRSPSDPVHRDLDALVAFSRALGRFVERRRGSGTLLDYLDAVGRADFGADPWLPPERAAGGVQLLSLHHSKGKQWSVVFVAGCVEGAIPKGRRGRGLFDPYFLDQDSPVARALHHEAEDRRVFYVAVTRARRRCVVTTSPGPSRKGQPSRFIAELCGGVPDPESARDLGPLTYSEAAARLRRTLSDVAAPAPERLAALGGLAHIAELDPDCAAARPREWWWRWDWTEGAVALRAHQRAEGLAEGKLRTSYSRISQYDNCGLAYLCSVVLGLDPDTSHNMAFGSWIHEIFEDCEKEPSAEQAATGRRRLRNEAMALARFEELFDPGVFPNQAIARQFHRDGVTMIQRYGQHLKPGASRLSEHAFKVDLDGHQIHGRIDRVDVLGSGLVVSDYKTSRNPIGYNEARDSLQLAIYYLAATKDPAIAAHGKPISMQLVYPGAPLARGQVARRCQEPKEAEEVLRRLPVLIDGVMREDFRPHPEADCKWCDFKPLCPLWPQGRELPS